LVDKPGRRKTRKTPWGKIAGLAIVALLIGGAGWEIYWTHIYQAPPVYAKLGTSQGYIYLELYPSCAPAAVANFVNLTNSGFYDDLVWHRIMPGFVIQTGDPNTRGAANSTRSTWGEGGSSQSVPFEWCGKLNNDAGYLGMASTSPKGPSTSQFFINLVNNPSLDGNYTVFGKVIAGMSAVCALANPSTDPTYGKTEPSLPSSSPYYTQPAYPARAMLNNATIIPASEAPPPQTLTPCS
jgi:cyclophilin family peptidyl-prolyl cis-trans isomerase